MEKVIYTLASASQKAADIDPSGLAQALMASGAEKIRINLRDEAVEPAKSLAQQSGNALPHAVVQCWLPTANPKFRVETDKVIAALSADYHAWLVSEATIIANERHKPTAGARTHGFAQMAFLTLPQDMPRNSWRKIWRDSHTQIAIDTQSNFEYVQNLVVEPLTEGAPAFIGIVEECFPPEAMTDPLTFFDATGDEDKFTRNLAAMMASCERFITPGSIDVFATSQYDFS